MNTPRWILMLLLSIAAQLPFELSVRADDDFDRLVHDAVRHYEAKEYELAADKFQAAYAVQAEPELVFNVARSFERAALHTRAIAAYEQLLGLSGTTAEVRGRALAAIKALKAELTALKESSAPVPASAPSAMPASTAAAAPTVTTDSDSQVRAEAASPEPKHRTKRLGWMLAGGGLVTAALGGVFAGLAVKANGDLDEEPALKRQKELKGDVETYSLGADALFGLGAGLAATGLVLVLIDDTDERPSSGQGLNAKLVPRGTGLSLEGRF